MYQNRIRSIFILICLLLIFTRTGLIFAQERNVNKMLKQLNHRKSYVRAQAVKDLGKAIAQGKIDNTKRKEITNKLIKTLQKDKNVHVRTKTVEILGITGDKSVVPQVIETVKNDESVDTRFSAVLSLGQLRDESAIPILKEIFLDEKEDLGVRLQAGNALSYYAEKDVVDTLALGLKNDNSKIRLQAVCSLGNIMSDFMLKARIRLLRQAENDSDDRVKQYAKDMLEKLQPKKAKK